MHQPFCEPFRLPPNQCYIVSLSKHACSGPQAWHISRKHGTYPYIHLDLRSGWVAGVKRPRLPPGHWTLIILGELLIAMKHVLRCIHALPRRRGRGFQRHADGAASCRCVEHNDPATSWPGHPWVAVVCHRKPRTSKHGTKSVLTS